jgi:hypothetical protein
MKVVLYTVAAGLVMGLAGCSDEAAPGLASAPTGFQTDVSLASEMIYRGQSTDLTLEIANYGYDIELDFACMDHFGFRIEDDQGNTVYEYPSCYPTASHLTMRKGYKNTVIFSVPGGTLPSLEEGYYKVSAGIMEHEDEYPWEKKNLTIIEPR